MGGRVYHGEEGGRGHRERVPGGPVFIGGVHSVQGRDRYKR